MSLVFEPLTELHDIQNFRSGGSYLDHYLKNDALAEQTKDYARSFVALDSNEESRRVLGYFTLKLSPQSLPQLSNDWVSVVELACLARDSSMRGLGLGSVLLLEALRYIVGISTRIGFPGVFLYATEEGRALYEAHGFTRVSEGSRAYFISLSELKAVVASVESF